MMIFLLIFLFQTMISLICYGSSLILEISYIYFLIAFLFINCRLRSLLNFYLYLFIDSNTINTMALQSDYEVFQIGDQHTNYEIVSVAQQKIFNGEHSYRKAHRLPYKPNQNKPIFVDDTFRVQVKQNELNQFNHKYAVRRIYEIYDKDLDFLSDKLTNSVLLKPREFYPSFQSEFSMIDHTYLKTLFFTKTITEKGFYKYFVRRNGQYYVQVMDDLIPVDPETRLPPWGLSEYEPWKILLMKAWLKQKKSITAMITAEPYEFIQAFGSPGYRAICIPKQLNHLASSSLKAESKEAKEKRIPLDIPGFIIVGKTRNNEEVKKMGLVPNRAGYRITKTKFENKSVLRSEIRGASSSSHIPSSNNIPANSPNNPNYNNNSLNHNSNNPNNMNNSLTLNNANKPNSLNSNNSNSLFNSNLSPPKNQNINNSTLSSKMQPNDKGEDNLYKVTSSLPSYWVGDYSIYANGRIHLNQYTKLTSDIEKIESEFFASYYEISHVFNKFYIAPQYTSNKLGGNLLEDSINITVGLNPYECHLFELKVDKTGYANINIELPRDSAQMKQEINKSTGKPTGNLLKRFSYIKYFMARREPNERQNELVGYSYYDGEYVKGYHKSCNRFIQVEPGLYYIYFKVQPNANLKTGKTIAINLNTNARVQSFRKVDLRLREVSLSFIMQSALHNYNVRYGLKTYVGNQQQRSKNLVVHISNSFDEIGFGMISISARPPTKMILAMHLYPEKFRQKRMGICWQAHEVIDDKDQERLIKAVVKESQAKIRIIEKMIKERHIDEKFPPADSVDFFHVL